MCLEPALREAGGRDSAVRFIRSAPNRVIRQGVATTLEKGPVRIGI